MNATTVAPEPPQAPPLEKETTAGNYFVSNYPPFSFWKPEFVPELHAALDRAPVEVKNVEGHHPSSIIHHPPSLAPLGLYVHIPFCRKRCHLDRKSVV